MITIEDSAPATTPVTARLLQSRDEAAHYVARVCFKTGPPALTGVELEHTVHRLDDPAEPVGLTELRTALGPFAPITIDPRSPSRRLPGGGSVTVEPGGQVEISSLPHSGFPALHASVETDLRALEDLLRVHRLGIGDSGFDPRSRPGRLLRTPRYDAMARAFDQHGTPHGSSMMVATAGLQVCVDSGRDTELPSRWAALHAMGPVLLALFSTSRRPDAACVRMRTWLGMEPGRTHAVATDTGDPVSAWVDYVLRAPVLCVRRDGRPWFTPRDVSFEAWLGGALPDPPSLDDLELHLSMLFPPVRPRGYLEVRYLDTQPRRQWFAPVAVIGALLASASSIDKVRDLCAPVEGRWLDAATRGLADPDLRQAAAAVAALACDGLAATDVPEPVRHAVATIVDQRLAALHTQEA
ncbi:glutamate-cysteine ligase family protein [Stackebrandtia nassauensis]|uniref:Glutamate--cysteine ligase EgtA n=1 Tax=Stackebrandtia nassauensis (strain DSM 44728 / CIP 108903 / NRRL B-16338 / NBRC 102104 / LLR-40K-21) TaxID=446470 RepID=D3QBR4_STANL|nr:glutamate-cysteine ligase family protein [Stackebrandtia nassauensis]ADD44803.1 glutamate--cysteine ligase GCS2 [Stackebrandtia nassauensis DSM 44728]